MGTDKRFQIALSFPGERRAFVQQVAEHLGQTLGPERVLYDAWYEAEFARPDLDTYLQALYHDQSDLICVFLCADYERKEWCGLEWRALRDLIKRRQGSAIMPLRFDLTEVPGLFSTDGYVWIGDGRSAAEVAALILQRWRLNAGVPASDWVLAPPLPLEPAAPEGGGPFIAEPEPAPRRGGGIQGLGRRIGEALGTLKGGGVAGTALPGYVATAGPVWGWLAGAVKRLLPWPGQAGGRLVEDPIRLDVAYPPEALVDTPFDLAVAVRLPDSPPLDIADLPALESAKGKVFHAEDEDCIRYRIAVQPPPDCEVEPFEWAILLRPGADAEPVFFKVVCHGDGTRSFFVVAYQDDNAVAAQTRVAIPVRVEVAAPGTPAEPTPAPPTNPLFAPTAPPPGARPPATPAQEVPTMALTRLPAERFGLLPIAACRDPGRRLDLVLVHGLGGDAFTTWMADRDDMATFWPNWLARDRPGIWVWTLGYAADASGWKAESMALADRGTQVLDLLENEGLGERPLVFVTHSLGGIVAKQLLRHADGFGVPRWRGIAEQTRGIAFIATPHSGANLASFAEFASAVFRTNEQVKELASHDARLRELHNWFRAFYAAHGLICRTWCERRAVRPEIPWLGIRLPRGIVVVDATSAEPGLPGEVAVPLDEDHISICKPASPSAQLYRSLLRWLDDCVEAAATRPPVAPAARPRPEAPRPSPALATWQEKLVFLLEQEALAVDPAQKFKLRRDIEECRAKIRELGGEA